MRILTRCALSIGAAVFFAGCGGSPPSSAGFGAAPLRVPAHSVQRSSSSQDALIYLALYDYGGYAGSIYDYKTGEFYNHFYETPYAYMVPAGICSDNKGDVFLTGSNGSGAHIFKYTYGATAPSGSVSFQGGEPQGCSVNNATGDLAAVVRADPSFVAVFPGFQGPPKEYTSPCGYYVASVTYDANANLFLLCLLNGGFELAELHNGDSSFKTISVSSKIHRPLVIQWDGKYVAATAPREIYRLKVSGSSATLVGTVKVAAIGHPYFQDLQPTWIQRNLGIAAGIVRRSAAVGLWKYPAGGKQIQTDANSSITIGVTVAGPYPDTSIR